MIICHFDAEKFGNEEKNIYLCTVNENKFIKH